MAAIAKTLTQRDANHQIQSSSQRLSFLTFTLAQLYAWHISTQIRNLRTSYAH